MINPAHATSGHGLHAMTFLLCAGLSTGCPQSMERATEPSEAGILVSAAAMHSVRAAHTATPLADGRVLVAGGFTSREGVIGAELFDPVSARFVPGGPMAPRQSHTATMLPDGKVLLAGGYDARGAYLASAEIFDPASGTFVPTGSMKTGRAGHTAARLSDGRVLLVGGVGNGWTFLSSAECYDPATGTFSVTGSMTVARESHIAVRLEDGRVLIVGGHRGRNPSIELFASMEAYDPATGSFAPAGSMTVARHKHDAVLLQDGRVLITGGSDERDSRGTFDSAEIYDPATGTSLGTARMRLARYKHQGTSVVLPDGRVLIAGGATRAEVYDPRTSTFELVGGGARMVGQFSAAAPLSDGRVLVTGGYGEGQGPQAGAWLYQRTGADQPELSCCGPAGPAKVARSRAR